MPPTIPESDFEAMDDDYETSNVKRYHYEVKFEVVMKEGTKTIPGKASLVKAMTTIKNAKRKAEKIDFFDTNGLQISPDLRGIDQDEIEDRFCMEVGGINDNKLFFACSILTDVTFSILKGRTLDEFKKHNIYFKIHKGGFKFGVNWSPIGFFLKQHPGFIDTVTARDNLRATIANSWYHDKSFFDEDQKTKIAQTIEPGTHLESFDPLLIPFQIIQTTISAKNSDNDAIRTNAAVVMIPFQFFKVGITIMDYMTITTDTIDNYIPLGYKKEEPDNFFNIVYEHNKWMENIRHISITNIPTNRQFKEETDALSGKSLETALQQITDIEYLGYIRSKKLVHAAVSVKKIQQTIESIQEILIATKLPYKPLIAKRFNPNRSLGSIKSGTSKYSAAMAKYQSNRSPNASIATSQGEDVSRLTGYTGRSWGNQRKIPKEIDFTDNTQFPTLTANQPSTDPLIIPHTATLDDSITDTTVIQQAIDSALKKAYELHLKEMTDMQEKFNQQLDIIRSQQQNTNLESKVDRLMEILLMDKQTSIDRESPIRKKGRPNNLNQTAFESESTPTRSNCQTKDPSDDTQMTDQSHETEPPMGPHFERESLEAYNNYCITHDDASNTSSSESSESDWITKTKKEKKFPKMTQTKLVTMMKHGGYGNNDSPPRKNTATNQYNPRKQTPPRAGRGSPSRSTQMDKQTTNDLRLTKLPSTRSGPKDPHGRED
jgi:hypothetical protein